MRSYAVAPSINLKADFWLLSEDIRSVFTEVFAKIDELIDEQIGQAREKGLRVTVSNPGLKFPVSLASTC